MTRSLGRSCSRIGRSPRRAGRTRRSPRRRPTVGCVAARASSIRARSPLPRRRRAAFSPIQSIGGATGWYKGALLWRIRGLLDVVVGGPGLRRGRRDPVAPSGRRHRRLLARRGDRAGQAASPQRRDEGARTGVAPVRGLPGRRARRARSSRQTAIFDPAGLFGLVYWYSLWPFHGYIFGGMLKNLAAAATRAHT